MTLLGLDFPAPAMPEEAEKLRREVRAFLADQLDQGRFTPVCDGFMRGIDFEFSRELGARGWLGMTWPTEYGGRAASNLERYVVIEELLAAGAPVAAHWIAERQTGALLLRFGSEYQRQLLMPGIAKGTLFVSIGMSETESGSDLASVRTSATQCGDRWILNGGKIWSSHAHYCHYMVALVRTAASENKREGLSQVLIDLTWAGIDIRPVDLFTGERHFNQVTFDDVEVPAAMVVGNPGDGWMQVTSELGWERSGPERFMSTFPLLVGLVDYAKEHGGAGIEGRIADLFADLFTLRQMSLAVASALDSGRAPEGAAAAVKDMATAFENRVIEIFRESVDSESLASGSPLARTFESAVVAAPGFTIRGGTSEILRTVVARELLRG